jgi:hypothetical protein
VARRLLIDAITALALAPKLKRPPRPDQNLDGGNLRLATLYSCSFRPAFRGDLVKAAPVSLKYGLLASQ